MYLRVDSRIWKFCLPQIVSYVESDPSLHKIFSCYESLLLVYIPHKLTVGITLLSSGIRM